LSTFGVARIAFRTTTPNLAAMITLRRCVGLVALLPLLAVAVAAADAGSVVTQARKYLGKDRDLDEVRTLHYRGRVEVAAGGKTESGSFEMLLQKPLQNLTIQVIGDRRTTIGLDDMSGWVRVESVAKPALCRTEVLDLPQLRNLRAQTLENLLFFRGMDKSGVKVEFRGESVVDGRHVSTLAFAHPHGIVYSRSFDSATGQLLVTEVPGGVRMREEGDQLVSGIRFPKRLVSTNKNPDGSEAEVSIYFDEIKVNETFAPDAFAVPLLGNQR